MSGSVSPFWDLNESYSSFPLENMCYLALFWPFVIETSLFTARSQFPCPVPIILEHYGLHLLTSVLDLLVPGASHQLPRAHGRGRGGGD